MEDSVDKTAYSESSADDDDIQQRVEKLLAQVTELQSEQRKSSDEFDVQRGKMKELFLQQQEERNRLQEEMDRLKVELDEARSQVTVTGLDLQSKLEEERAKSQEELASLQQLLAETLEENSKNENELKILKQKNEKLEAEIGILKCDSGGGSGAPLLAAPTAMFSTLARKVASQLGATDNQQSAENLEDSMRKVSWSMKKQKLFKQNPKAKEDAEVLRSLVLPLEEEISVLKTKLRDTHQQLKKYQDHELDGTVAIRSLHSSGGVGTLTGDVAVEYEKLAGSSSEELCTAVPEQQNASGGCDMCSNYEAQLVQAEARCSKLEKEVATLDKYKEELAKETMFRKEMEDKWTEKKEEHKAQVTELQKRMKTAEDMLAELREKYKRHCIEIEKQFNQLKEERRATQHDLKRIELENDNLMGKYNAHSRELQNEEINLPDTVEALQEMWLRQREDLIKAKVGQERCEESVKSLECLYNSATVEQSQLSAQVGTLNVELANKDKILKQNQDFIDKLEQTISKLKEEMHELRSLLQTVKDEKKQLEDLNTDMKNRLISLQMGLENGEAVQKDFVRLSQTLQKELENLRAQNNVLRWEYEEDVMECRGCEQQFKSSSKGKYNCRHCGKIFCGSCLSHKVMSGPSCKESRVCDVCHTLLNKESAPYFSTDPPHTNK